jgi:hypothetical protein
MSRAWIGQILSTRARSGCSNLRTEVQWEEPEPAKALWREKCPRVDFDLVTLGEGGLTWERRRNGELVPLFGEGFRTKFSGRPDLLETTRTVD